MQPNWFPLRKEPTPDDIMNSLGMQKTQTVPSKPAVAANPGNPVNPVRDLIMAKMNAPQYEPTPKQPLMEGWGNLPLGGIFRSKT